MKNWTKNKKKLRIWTKTWRGITERCLPRISSRLWHFHQNCTYFASQRRKSRPTNLTSSSLREWASFTYGTASIWVEDISQVNISQTFEEYCQMEKSHSSKIWPLQNNISRWLCGRRGGLSSRWEDTTDCVVLNKFINTRWLGTSGSSTLYSLKRLIVHQP